jgi:hypothetical protein
MKMPDAITLLCGEDAGQEGVPFMRLTKSFALGNTLEIIFRSLI